MREFMMAYNESLRAKQLQRAAPPLTAATNHMAPAQRVGRNAPCPSGSGKRFKEVLPRR